MPKIDDLRCGDQASGGSAGAIEPATAPAERRYAGTDRRYATFELDEGVWFTKRFVLIPPQNANHVLVSVAGFNVYFGHAAIEDHHFSQLAMVPRFFSWDHSPERVTVGVVSRLRDHDGNDPWTVEVWAQILWEEWTPWTDP